MMDVIEAPLAPQEAKDEGCLTVGCDYPAGTSCAMAGCPGRNRSRFFKIDAMPLRRKLRVLSMFSGCGAIDLGLERVGEFEPVAFCEIDPTASAILARHWPHVPNLGDVTKADFTEIKADMIAAGFPCQDLSNAGLRAGLAGTRSGLFWEVVRAVRVVRPRFVLLENVAALHNRGLGEVLGALASLGYDCEVDCIPASYIGAPHDRDRTFIVAHAIGSEWRSEPYRRALGRMGRVQQSVPWNRDWQGALREFRGMDDGSAYRVDRIDTIRNAVVVPLVTGIANAILQAISNERPDYQDWGMGIRLAESARAELRGSTIGPASDVCGPFFHEVTYGE